MATTSKASPSSPKFVEQVNAAGGNAKMMSLPAMGIYSNSHMLMMDKNNRQIADLIIGWIDENVEGKKPRRSSSK